MANESENVFLSIQKRCESELTADTIRFENQDVRTLALSAWHRVSLLSGQALSSRAATRDERYLIQISNFAKTGTGNESTIKVWQMRDDIYAAFFGKTFDVGAFHAGGDDSKVADIRIVGDFDADLVSEGTPELTHLACTFTGLVIFNP